MFATDSVLSGLVFYGEGGKLLNKIGRTVIDKGLGMHKVTQKTTFKLDVNEKIVGVRGKRYS